MSTETVTPNVVRQPRLGTLGRVAVAALVILAVYVVGGGFVIGGEFDPFTLVIAGIALLPALLAATGWRWAMGLLAVLSTLLLLAAAAFLGPSLARPHEPEFALVVPMLALVLVAATAGWGATVQNIRGGTRGAPRWLPYALFALGGLVVGAVAVGLIPQQGAVAAVTDDVLAGMRTLSTQDFDFSQHTIEVTAGETVALRLENHDGTAHAFDIDELGVHALIPSNEPGLAIFRVDKPGTYTFYCSIPGHADLEAHTGMVGTLVVDPPAAN